MKKKLLVIFTFFITISTLAQAPDLINYQAIIRNTEGNLVQDANIGMRISILQTNATGTAVYTETHVASTNTNGLVTIMIGGGTSSEDFSTIDWSAGPYFIKTETDIAGGTNYTIIGTSQLLSVPYALYAKNGTKFTETTEGLEYDGGDITLTQPGATIKLTSPDGTVYELGINDNGQLSVPTSNTSSTTPTNFYLYGSFNNWDASTALEFGNNVDPYGYFIGMRYFDAGTEIKFLAAQNESIVYGGTGFSNGELVENGNALTIPSDGLYRIQVFPSGGGMISYIIESINLSFNGTALTYGSDGVDFFPFAFLPNSTSQTGQFNIGGFSYGDNLGDLSLELNGESITTPTSANAIRLNINFNCSFTYQYYNN